MAAHFETPPPSRAAIGPFRGAPELRIAPSFPSGFSVVNSSVALGYGLQFDSPIEFRGPHFQPTNAP